MKKFVKIDKHTIQKVRDIAVLTGTFAYSNAQKFNGIDLVITKKEHSELKLPKLYGGEYGNRSSDLIGALNCISCGAIHNIIVIKDVDWKVAWREATRVITELWGKDNLIREDKAYRVNKFKITKYYIHKGLMALKGEVI